MDGKGLLRGMMYGFLVLYVLWALTSIGVTGLLLSFSVALIASSFDLSTELVLAITILSGLLWKRFVVRSKEAFTGEPVGEGQGAVAIAKKVEQITRKNVFEPSGVLSSSFAEGFADATDAEKPKDANATATTASAPASTQAPTATMEMAKDLPTASAAAASTPPAQQTPPPSNGAQAQPTTSGFGDKKSEGHFKLGSIPSDAAGGAHIDVGTTLMNALNSLKPDQVKQMTEDTRKLMETQKSLMGMLSNMKPMLQDGKQMMDTFQEMFGKS